MMLQTVLLGSLAAGALAVAPCLCARGPNEGRLGGVGQAVQAADTATVKLHISGMTCGGCATTARLALKKLDGVLDATVTIKDSLGVVRYDPQKTGPAEIAGHLTRLTGYQARVLADSIRPGRKP